MKLCSGTQDCSNVMRLGHGPPKVSGGDIQGGRDDIVAYRVVSAAPPPAPSAPVKTLRDEFAMAALNSIMFSGVHPSVEDAADIAYSFADAILKAREV